MVTIRRYQRSLSSGNARSFIEILAKRLGGYQIQVWEKNRLGEVVKEACILLRCREQVTNDMAGLGTTFPTPLTKAPQAEKGSLINHRCIQEPQNKQS